MQPDSHALAPTYSESLRLGMTTPNGFEWSFRIRRDADESASAPSSIRSEKLARLEAVLLVADGPLTTRKLAQHAILASPKEATALLTELDEAYARDRSAFRVERVASGYRLLTRPVFARWLKRLHDRQDGLTLSPPALETLTIVAYRQPITRADLEMLRGVQCAEMLKQLMDRGLVRINGTEDTLGRPFLYETTKLFLEQFGLRSLADLPDEDGLRSAG